MKQIDDLMKLLMSTTIVQSLNISDSAENSKLSMAFIGIKSQVDATKLFIKLFEKSKTIEAKVYALLGLFMQDKDCHNVFATQLKTHDLVLILEGCMVWEYTVGEVISKIEDGSLQYLILNI